MYIRLQTFFFPGAICFLVMFVLIVRVLRYLEKCKWGHFYRIETPHVKKQKKFDVAVLNPSGKIDIYQKLSL